VLLGLKVGYQITVIFCKRREKTERKEGRVRRVGGEKDERRNK